MTSGEIVVNLGDTSPRRLLVAWANGQDAWIRALTAEAILSRQEVSDDVLATIYDTFLAEKGLSGEAVSRVPQLELEADEFVVEESLELCAISNVEGVNALAPDQTLEFDPDLARIVHESLGRSVLWQWAVGRACWHVFSPTAG